MGNKVIEPKHPLPAPMEMGSLGIRFIPRYWKRSWLKKNGQLNQEAYQEEWNIDNALLNALGLGLEQTIIQVYQHCRSLEEFERWIGSTVDLDQLKDRIRQFNEFIEQGMNQGLSEEIGTVLRPDEWKFWEENGYIIIKNAISKEDAQATVQLICEHINIDPNDPQTWYHPHPSRQGIMIQLFQHEQLEKNRHSKKIRQVYEQLWGRKDIHVNTDRVGFNPPETDHWKFPGPRMHWDVSLALPIPFGLQGILYLADTALNQGAFTLVPGFHLKIEEWIHSLPPGTNPRTRDMDELGPLPIAAEAGDFIIWHQALPHGSSPNRSEKPRYVQYFNYAPLDVEHQEKWI